MGGAPIFSLFRETRPALELLRFRGLLNSTTSVILSEMEAGRSFEAAVKRAQELGIAETDPSADIDGWDAAVKVVALAAVLMDTPVRLEEVEIKGIRDLSGQEVQTARQDGKVYKLVSRIERQGDKVQASVKPERLEQGDPLAAASPTSLLAHFETDVIPGLTLVLHQAGPVTTAYDMLADFISIARQK